MDTIDQLDRGVDDVEGLLELAIEAEDQETFDEIGPELDELEAKLEQLEFRRMFSGDHDSSDCYLDLQALWRYRSARLDVDAAAHVLALGRC